MDERTPSTSELIARIEDLEARLDAKRRGSWPAFGRKGRLLATAVLALSLAAVPSIAGATPSQVFWALTGNAGTTAANFLGTIDNNPLVIKTNNTTAMTVGADQNVTTTGSLNAAGGLQENGTALSNKYAEVDGSNATGTWGISTSGNAGTVTHGLYDNQTYNDPGWLASVGASKITGTLAASNIPDLSGTYVKTDGSNATGPWSISTIGNAGSVTNGVYTTGNQTINGTKDFTNTIKGNISGYAAAFTGILTGDVTGTQGGTTVQRIQGVGVSNTAPSGNDVLQYNSANSQWQPTPLSTTLPTVTVASATFTVRAQASIADTMPCPSSSYTAIDGGFQADNYDMHVFESFPVSTATDTTVAGGNGDHAWRFNVENPTSSTQGVSFYVTCLKTS